jgi:outer membrane protein assembly factor BamC
MQMKLPKWRIVLSMLLCAAVVGCGGTGSVLPDHKADYKKSKSTDRLEVPPDLTSTSIREAPAGAAGTAPETAPPSTATYSEFSGGQRTRAESTVLPDQENMRIERDGDKQWLVIQGEPSQVWPVMREFWLQAGFLISYEDPRIGILETGWAENRADIPQDAVRRALGKVMDWAYTAATRDKFRVRLERGSQPGVTELYLTHRGMEEVIEGPADEASSTKWRPRPADPELEAEMLKRMMVYMGVEEERARQQLAQQNAPRARAQLVSTAEGSLLILDEDFSRAWRRTGIALDRVGFAVEDRNRSDGVYFVRYLDPLKGNEDNGILSKLAFWSDDDQAKADQYQVKLIAEGPETHVVVLDKSGARDSSGTAKRILTLLQEQLQ